MKRKHSHIADEAEVDMTPMLDIVFIMLIFFIVTTSFVKESGLDIQRPANSQTNSAQQTNVEPVVIRISADDRITVNKREVDFRAIEGNVQSRRSQNSKAPVIVITHPDASMDVVTKVVDAVKRAGVDKVNVATESGEK
ncbi:MAG: biopolymer transporter ExbD [Gammaproteobacteria bacterium]|nr:MAG: biopolymer transporter ExbD [Gammaproteobacteria bacterium]